MRYLRLLLNSVLAGGIAATYLAILFLQLNPSLPLDPAALGPLLAALLLTYGLHFAAVSYAVMVLWQMIGAGRLSPAWVSLRVLAWLAASVASGGAALMWLNLTGLRPSLTSDAAQNMALGAAIVTLCAITFLLLALVRHSVRPNQWRVGAALFVLTLMVSIAAPVVLRGPGTERPAGGGTRGLEIVPAVTEAPAGARVVMLLVDGASLDYVSLAAAEGRLPNLGRILDAGAAMHLATLRPTQPEPVWTAVATGMLPARSGIRSRARYRAGEHGPSFDLLPDYCLSEALVYLGFLRETRHSSDAIRASTLWEILSASGIASAVVRWPVSYPARPLNGILITDQLHGAPDSSLHGARPLTFPRGLAERLQARLSPAAVSPVISGVPHGAPYPGVASLAVDRFYADVFNVVQQTAEARFLAMRYQGLDTAGHYYLREALPQAFGDRAARARSESGRVLDEYYRYIDEEVGRSADGLGPEDLLLVVSAFGMEPLSLPKRLLARLLGGPELAGTHERAPDGFLMAYGAGVRPGRLPRASILDVVPTVLYYFGLPIGRDMDGFARTDLFAPSFTEDRPLTFIPSYER